MAVMRSRFVLFTSFIALLSACDGPAPHAAQTTTNTQSSGGSSAAPTQCAAGEVLVSMSPSSGVALQTPMSVTSQCMTEARYQSTMTANAYLCRRTGSRADCVALVPSSPGGPNLPR